MTILVEKLQAEIDRLTALSARYRKLLEEIVPAARDILWCAIVWNDHNFTLDDLRAKAKRAGECIGLIRGGKFDAIEEWNQYMERVDAALAAEKEGT